MYAFSMAFFAMILLRRLATPTLLLGSLAFVAAQDALTSSVWDAAALDGGGYPWPLLLTMDVSQPTGLIVAYPVLPWLVQMVLGWVVGAAWFSEEARAATRLGGRLRADALLATRLALSGIASLGVYAIVRSLDGYGNARLHSCARGAHWWLHVSKYPPSMSYMAFFLGVLLLCLSCLTVVQRMGDKIRWLTVLGQTALFYYIAHLVIIWVVTRVASGHPFDFWQANHGELPKGTHTLALSLFYYLALIALLLPTCHWYLDYKRARPESFLRYI